ncbi:hypothetical protein QL285_072002 [Trifolium repens]|jgi:hypothetical protein|nr:hypothetical protein QL285_072002 [Trifolium repens]
MTLWEKRESGLGLFKDRSGRCYILGGDRMMKMDDGGDRMKMDSGGEEGRRQSFNARKWNISESHKFLMFILSPWIFFCHVSCIHELNGGYLKWRKPGLWKLPLPSYVSYIVLLRIPVYLTGLSGFIRFRHVVRLLTLWFDQ